MSKFQFYATLLDGFEGYLNSSRTYQEYWGFSENPSKSDEEFEQEQFQGLIDRINRVPFSSEAADKGTAFNEVVDCIIENRTSDKMEIKSFKESGVIAVTYNGHLFNFPFDLCIEFAKYFKGALTQQFTEGIIETKYGPVRVYGYIDEILPFKVADIKTTGKYSAFKYKNGYQHLVYPFCLKQNGVDINEFEYTVTDFKNTWTELYVYNEERDLPKLVQHCERFIEFLELHRDKITDLKIFGLDKMEVVA